MNGRLNRNKCLLFFLTTAVDLRKTVPSLNALDEFSRAHPDCLKRNIFRSFRDSVRTVHGIRSNGELQAEFNQKLEEALRMNRPNI